MRFVSTDGCAECYPRSDAQVFRDGELPVTTAVMESPEWWLALLALGAVVGLLAGLFGIGGGTVLVPVLTLLFAAAGVPHANVLHLALGTSMAAIVPTAIASAWAHHRHGMVNWLLVERLAPGIVGGTLVGAMLAPHLPTRALALFFALFIAVVAWRMWRSGKSSPEPQLLTESAPIGVGKEIGAAVGAGIGAISALVSIGGGTMTVPWLVRCRVPLRSAIGTSAAVGVVIAVVGSLGYLMAAVSPPATMAHVAGAVYAPAVGAIALTSISTAPLGSMLSQRLPVALLRRAFALLLLTLCGAMLFSLFRS